MRLVRPLTIVLMIIVLAKSASAEVLIWDFSIDESQVKNGPEPDGSTNSPATGTGHIEYDTHSNIISYSVSWNNLFGALTKLHVHGPATAAMSNPQHLVEIFGPPDVPATVDTHSDTWTASHPLEQLQQSGTNPATGLAFDPITPTQIIAIMQSGQSYLNVHTNVFGVGEIRGNLGLPVTVPEPNSWFLLAVGVWLCSGRTWHKQKVGNWHHNQRSAASMGGTTPPASGRDRRSANIPRLSLVEEDRPFQVVSPRGFCPVIDVRPNDDLVRSGPR